MNEARLSALRRDVGRPGDEPLPPERARVQGVDASPPGREVDTEPGDREADEAPPLLKKKKNVSAKGSWSKLGEVNWGDDNLGRDYYLGTGRVFTSRSVLLS